MFASLRCYFVHRASAGELAERVELDFADRIAARPGFISYEFLDGGGPEAMTVSVFRDAAQAQGSRALAKQWTEEAIGDMELTLTEAFRGEVVIDRGGPWDLPATAGRTVDRPFASVRRYRLLRGDVRQFLCVVGARFADLVMELDGFRGYRSVDCGGGEFISISTFQDRPAAAASDDLARQTLREELAEFGLDRAALIGGGHVVVTRVAAERPAMTGRR